ncbi:MAG: PD-(D/E)XK nuclease family protein [Thermoplasmata archaeon]
MGLFLLLMGLALTIWAARALSARRQDSALGRLVAVDAGAPATLRSYRYRIQGRPDSLRETSDGSLIPVEVKSRGSPRGGPVRSHLVQVWAYCLLVEESTGRAPPFGILRYADAEFRVRWDAPARQELLAIRAELARPYDGRANPSPARCARCPWVAVCDARASARRRRYRR